MPAPVELVPPLLEPSVLEPSVPEVEVPVPLEVEPELVPWEPEHTTPVQENGPHEPSSTPPADVVVLEPVLEEEDDDVEGDDVDVALSVPVSSWESAGHPVAKQTMREETSPNRKSMPMEYHTTLGRPWWWRAVACSRSRACAAGIRIGT